jgi:hypothetical protein
MNYTSPAVESNDPIAEAFVLGVVYFTPSWTDQPDQGNQSPS